MKIRIKENSVRIRLSKPEVERFGAEGYIEANTPFVTGVLTYALESRPGTYGHELSADFKESIITMYVPERMVTEWVNTEKVGYDTAMGLDNGETLYLKLEKDFKCLDETIEDQSDNYDNPLLAKGNS